MRSSVSAAPTAPCASQSFAQRRCADGLRRPLPAVAEQAADAPRGAVRVLKSRPETAPVATGDIAAAPEPWVEAVVAQHGLAPAAAVVAAPRAEPALDAEKLVVYAVALELQVLCAALVPVHHRVLQDQLERSSLSCVLNIGESAGRRSRKDKRRFVAIARGSATETAAIIDVLRLRRLAGEGACDAARSLALRVVQMLTKLERALM